ncbi:anucleate primary sterigmata protein B, putative, partial [Rhizoctonia solani AG-3 Rhs1AP]
MDVPAPATAHVDIPSGVLHWVDASEILAKEFIVTKPGGNRQVHGSLNSDEDLKGLQTANVTRAPNHHLVIQWSELRSAESTLIQRDADLAAVQTALRSLEAAREHPTTDKFSMELELDRLRRDLERCEDELARARRELTDAETRGREREAVVDKMHAEKRELETQLANLKTIETDTASYKVRITELESRLSKDQRSHATTEAQYREQITERNTLLLTICKYVDQVLGVDKKRSGDGKPFTNFSVFHDRILERLRSLTMINTEFTKRAKELEAKLMGKIQDLNKTLDARMRGLDKFEVSLKTVAETRQGELDALRTHNDELTMEIRHPSLSAFSRRGATNTEIKSLVARAERRLQNAKNQLASAEERFEQQSERNSDSEMRWEARLNAAEEKVKRNRQGAKERAIESENAVW